MAILIASAFLVAFVWAVRNGQYDDTYTPSVRILFDDPEFQEEKEARVELPKQKKDTAQAKKKK